MDIADIHDFLAALLRGDRVSLNQLRALLQSRVGESLWHDYKRGAWLRDDPGSSSPGNPTKAAAKLRKWISGFANSEGGFLVLGAADGTPAGSSSPHDCWRFTGCSAPGGGDFDNWITNALRPLLGHCHWRALVLTLKPSDCGAGAQEGPHVALIAVDRADKLVHCVEGQSVVTYLRSHESTFRAPEYLLQDILVGRRRQPDVQVVTKNFQRDPNPNFSGIGGAARLRWDLALDNASLAWADSVGLGVIAYTVRHESERRVTNLEPSPSVRSVLRDRGCHGGDYVAPSHGVPSRGPMEITAQRLQIRLPIVRPQSREASVHVDIPPLTSGFCAEYQAFVAGDFGDGVWCAGLYVVERNSRPRWFQLTALPYTAVSEARELPIGQGPLIYYGPIAEDSRSGGLSQEDRDLLGV
jgi:hypothetical protein